MKTIKRQRALNLSSEQSNVRAWTINVLNSRGKKTTCQVNCSLPTLLHWPLSFSYMLCSKGPTKESAVLNVSKKQNHTIIIHIRSWIKIVQTTNLALCELHISYFFWEDVSVHCFLSMYVLGFVDAKWNPTPNSIMWHPTDVCVTQRGSTWDLPHGLLLHKVTG